MKFPDVGDTAPSLAYVVAYPALVLFGRGPSCRRCVNQLNGVADSLAEFTAIGLYVVAVMPEPTRIEYPFPVVVDQGDKIGYSFGVAIHPKETQHGAFLVGSDGKIRWRYIDVHALPAADLLAALRRLKPGAIS